MQLFATGCRLSSTTTVSTAVRDVLVRRGFKAEDSPTVIPLVSAVAEDLPRHQGNLCLCCLDSRRALELLDNGEYLNALHLFQRAFDVNANPNDMYNIACCHALLADRAKAIQALKQSVAVGYKNWQHMASDSDLECLRNDEGFLMLVNSLEPTTSPDTPKATNLTVTTVL